MHDFWMISNFSKLDFTAVLTAALARGLELYVSSSTGSASGRNSSREKANSKQRQDGDGTRQGGHQGSSSTFQHGQHIPPISARVQESLQYLRAISIALSRCYDTVEQYAVEHRRMHAVMLSSGEPTS